MKKEIIVYSISILWEDLKIIIGSNCSVSEIIFLIVLFSFRPIKEELLEILSDTKGWVVL